jgi:hypothetical protein
MKKIYLFIINIKLTHFILTICKKVTYNMPLVILLFIFLSYLILISHFILFFKISFIPIFTRPI